MRVRVTAPAGSSREPRREAPGSVATSSLLLLRVWYPVLGGLPVSPVAVLSGSSAPRPLREVGQVTEATCPLLCP